MVGRTIAHYRVTANLGQGGMGAVYRATDTKLDREVAMKVLPESFTHDPERLARFEREAKALAALNHPNIAGIYGLEQSGDTQALILELVEGEDLSERLKRGPLPVDEALEVCKQITEALEAAHEKGIIHRDLKPGNIKLLPDGRVKVLDFGLVKVVSDAPSTVEGSTALEDSPTVFTKGQATMPGVLLGTAGYMSPEQARGRPVDKRSDIWSFGVVLFECLTRGRLFTGETVTDSVGALLHKEIDWNQLPPNTPPTIQLLLRKCLTRDRKRRLHDIADARVDLDQAVADPGSSVVKFGNVAPSGLSWPMVLPWAVAAVAIVAAAAAFLSTRKNRGESAELKEATVKAGPLRKLELPLSRSGESTQDRISGMSISPNGRKLAYVTREGLWLKALDQFDQPELLVASARASAPFWSPDSAHIAWFDHATLKRVSATDGRPLTICPITSRFPRSNIAGGGWLENQQIVFTTGYGGLFRVPAMGGDAEEFLLPTEDEDDYHEAAVMPDRKGVVFIIHRNSGNGRSDLAIDTIAAWRLGDETTRKRILYQDPGTQIYGVAVSSSGHLLFLQSRADPREPSPWALRFSVDTLEVIGDPFRLTVEGRHVSVSQEGTLALAGNSSRPPYQLVWVDRAGQSVVPVGPVQEGVAGALKLSPDERSAAYPAAERSDSRRVSRIWIANLEQGTSLPFTEEGESERYPFWLPSGRELAFVRTTNLGPGRNELRIRDVDGASPGRTLMAGFQLEHVSQSGNYALLRRITNSTVQNFYAQLSSSPIVPTPYPGRFSEGFTIQGKLSPDDSILAYTADESGEQEVYAVAFPGFTNRVIISRGGGGWPVWRPDGKELYYLDKDRRSLMSAPFLNQNSRLFGEPVKLFDLPSSAEGRSLAPTRDGERFLMWQELEDSEGTSANLGMNVLLIENWIEEYLQAL